MIDLEKKNILNNITTANRCEREYIEDEVIIIKTKSSIRHIGFGFFGAIFFGAFAYMMLFSEWKIADDTNYWVGMIILYLLCGVFLFFTFACLWMFVQIKTVVLTNKRLIIKRPLLFYIKNTPISNIKDISESPYKTNVSSRMGFFKFYDGKRIKIKFKNGKTIKLDSFEITEYDSLIRNLDLLLKNKNALLRNKQRKPLPTQKKYQGYGWLLFVAIMTCMLVYALINGK